MSMVCTRCGKPITGDPTWAKYADKGFQHRPAGALESFPLHADCYAAAEFIDVAEWETDKDGNAVLVEKGQQRRYRKVKGFIPS